MPERAASTRFALAGRVAVVTGGSRGIGAAIAAGLAEAGATVFALSRSGTAPATATALACDVADDRALRDAFAEIGRQTPTIDVLVNAAAVSLPPTSGSGEQELARLKATLAVDLVAAYAAILQARPMMQHAGGGSVVNVTSINAVRGFPGNPGYVASKAGLSGLTRALAVDLAADRIRVNALAPGYVRTAMTEASYSSPELNEQRRRHTVLGRWGTPDDMVGAVIFLASDASAYMTGQELFVDGGWTIKGLVT